MAPRNIFPRTASTSLFSKILSLDIFQKGMKTYFSNDGVSKYLSKDCINNIFSKISSFDIFIKGMKNIFQMMTSTNNFPENTNKYQINTTSQYWLISKYLKYLKMPPIKCLQIYLKCLQIDLSPKISFFSSRYLDYLNHIKINFLQNLSQVSPNRLFAICERVKLREPRGQELTESPKGGCLTLNITILADYSRSQIQNKKDTFKRKAARFWEWFTHFVFIKSC